MTAYRHCDSADCKEVDDYGWCRCRCRGCQHMNEFLASKAEAEYDSEIWDDTLMRDQLGDA